MIPRFGGEGATVTYLQGLGRRATTVEAIPQSEPLTGQVANSASGYSYPVDDWTRLHRFLILGAAGGSYYATERALTRENANVVERCITADGGRVVSEVVAISDAGRAPKNDPALFVLAMCAGLGNDATRQCALDALPKVARIGTHILHYTSYVEQFRGWGRGLRRAVGDWFNHRPVSALAYQAVKYQSRDKWALADLLRLAHPKPASSAHGKIMGWIVDGWPDGIGPLPPTGEDEALRLLWAFEQAKRATEASEIATLIHEFGLPREAIPTQFLTERVVWAALFNRMPVTALIRNLPTLTRVGLFESAEQVKTATERLTSLVTLKAARIHPITILAALKTYESGKSARGSTTWIPNPRLVDALDEAFYAAFAYTEPTNQRLLLALDVSGSMDWTPLAGIPGLTPRVASAALALVTARTEPNYEVVTFSHGLSPLALSPRQRLDDVCHHVARLPANGTDCALPMVWALQQQKAFDAFVVLTDSETWYGDIHPAAALERYRQQLELPAKLVVVGMVANGFSIADPNDGGMLDVVGFDTAVPQLLHDFLTGSV